MLNNITGQPEYDFPSRDDITIKRGDDDRLGSNIYFNPNNILDPLTQRGIELASERKRGIEDTQLSVTSARGSKIFLTVIIVLMIIGNFIIPGHS